MLGAESLPIEKRVRVVQMMKNLDTVMKGDTGPLVVIMVKPRRIPETGIVIVLSNPMPEVTVL